MRNLIVTLTVFLGITGCGGGGSSPQPKAFSPVGIWTGTAKSYSSIPSIGVDVIVFKDGSFRYASTNKVMAYGTFSIGDQNATANGTLVVLPNYYPSEQYPVQVTCSGITAQTMSGTYKSQFDNGTLSLTYLSNLNVPVSMSTLSGTYSDSGANTLTGMALTLNISPTGYITGSATVGSYSGTITQPEANVNAFQVDLTYSGDQIAGSPYNLKGAAFLDPVHGRLYLQLSDPRAGLGVYGMFIGSLGKN